MTTYGRNFDFRQSPLPQHRLGRYTTGATPIAIGAPVQVPDDADQDGNGRLPLELCTDANEPTDGPRVSRQGILVWEVETNNFAGYDPLITQPSDIDTAPAYTAVQLVHGTEVRVVFTNTEDVSFQGQRDYEGKVFVAGLGATPSLAVGDLLHPGTGDDVSGFWEETTDADEAWLVVTGVNADTGEVEAQMLF